MTQPAEAVPAVSCHGLRYRFGDTVAVDGIDLDVQPGEIFGLLGPNGAGKTTAIRAITALLPVPAEVILVFGRDVTRRRMAVRRMIGYVPQQLSADGSLTGVENVSLFARLFDVPRRQRTAQVAASLAMMGLSEVAGRLAGTYSGGMIRRLELAQALVSSPRLLILDEPTIGLDPVARAGVWERITSVRAQTGMTVLVTTHYMDEAEQTCDRVAMMHRGKIQAVGSPAALIAGLGPDVAPRPRPSTSNGLGLDDVFRAYTGVNSAEAEQQQKGIRDVRATRRTVRRVG